MRIKEYFIGGFFGAMFTILILFFLGTLFGVYDFRCFYIVNSYPDDGILNINTLETLKKLENCGLLLTPDQYTNNVVSFYNVILTFVGIVFVIFSIASFFIIRDNNLKETKKFVKEYLNDSKTFRDEIVTALTGEFDAHYINKEDFSNLYKDIDERLSSIENNNNRNEIE